MVSSDLFEGPIGRPRCYWNHNIKWILQKLGVRVWSVSESGWGP